MHREDDYLYGWVEPANLFGRIDAAQLRHANVHDDEIGLQFFRFTHSLFSVCSLAANGTESTLRNESLHTAPQKFVVINYQNSGIQDGKLPSGIRQCSRPVRRREYRECLIPSAPLQGT